MYFRYDWQKFGVSRETVIFVYRLHIAPRRKDQKSPARNQRRYRVRSIATFPGLKARGR